MQTQNKFKNKKLFKAKKSLGQNFLKSKLALNKIIQAGEITENDIILEIGPGKGILTEELLKQANLVIAVEKDSDLFVFLQEKFSKEIQNKKLILLEEDILKFNVPECSYKIIANIPYNITGAILKKFLTHQYQPERMILMIQQEVAQRIIGMKKNPTSHRAKQGKESLLSISVQAYGQPKIIMKVPARYFSPAPKVDSAIIAIKNISRDFFIKNQIAEKKFWEIIHLAFAHKRKKISTNFRKKIDFKVPPEIANQRAEDLSLSDWLKIIKN